MSVIAAMKNKLQEHLFLTKKGFISIYFLVLFLQLITVFSAQMINMENRLKATGNVIEVQQYLTEENRLISQLKCILKNNPDLPLEEIPFSGNFHISGNEVTVFTQNEEPEMIIITLTGSPLRIYDYEVIRSKKNNP